MTQNDAATYCDRAYVKLQQCPIHMYLAVAFTVSLVAAAIICMIPPAINILLGAFIFIGASAPIAVAMVIAFDHYRAADKPKYNVLDADAE